MPLAPDPIASEIAGLARVDALRRLDASEETLALISLVSVSWPDASVGCPKPNADYDMRITPGYRLVFRAGEDTAIYHTSARDVVFCTPEEEILPGVLRDIAAVPES